MQKKIILKSGKSDSLLRFHPWVFSGAIKKVFGELSDGDLVEVFDNHEAYLGAGHYGTGSIAVRILSFEQGRSISEILQSRIHDAYQYRLNLGLINAVDHDCYRLVFAEGDGLPGLIIDWYNGVAVIQAHSTGMHKAAEEITQVLKEIYGDRLIAVYDKSKETLAGKSGDKIIGSYLFGSAKDHVAMEFNGRFYIDWEGGQKTGFFIDQRENRRLLMNMAMEKKVLNTFSYTGGFSVAALLGGAKLVHSVDSSSRAVDLLNRNMVLNGLENSNHEAFCEDTMHFMERMQEAYDVIILDPPAYAKHQDARHHAVQGYKRLNAEAIRKIASGGLLMTFSCSQVVDRRLFNSTVISAAILAGRKVRIIQQLSQPADHPINAFHPEGEYLKGLLLYID